MSIQLLPRPQNMEFTSLITFATGMVFGAVFGAALGAIVMFVNGFLSPVGQAGLNLPFQISGMVILGIVGGLYARTVKGELSTRGFGELAVLGAFLTFVYDIITNIGFALFLIIYGLRPFPDAILIALVSGAIPSVIHVGWNLALFGVAAVPLVSAMKRMVRWR